VQQLACVVELEEANALLWVELDTARSKLAEVEHHEWTPTSENEGLKNDLENARTAHDAAVKDKALVQQAMRMKLQCFQDSVHKNLTKPRCDIEAFVATHGGWSTEFPTDASLSDFFKWFQMEIMLMPTAFAKCNENITCYALIGVFQILAGEGCEHLPEQKNWFFPSMLRSFGISSWKLAG
jgi:hypothetical protein